MSPSLSVLSSSLAMTSLVVLPFESVGHPYILAYLGHIIMRPSSLGGGRILRRTLSVRLSVCPSVPLSSVTSRHLANYNDTCTLRHAQRAAYRTAISAAQIPVNFDLTDDVDMMRQTGALYARANTIIRKFSFASQSTKLMLFRAFCSPIYGCQLWCSMFQYSVNKLRVAYNDASRLLFARTTIDFLHLIMFRQLLP